MRERQGKMAGAPKGNCNALMHGLYAKHYTPEQKEELRKMGYGDLRHEMNVARMIVADMVKIHKQLMAGEPVDIEKLTKLDNAACNVIDKVSLCATRYAILNGEAGPTGKTVLYKTASPIKISRPVAICKGKSKYLNLAKKLIIWNCPWAGLNPRRKNWEPGARSGCCGQAHWFR